MAWNTRYNQTKLGEAWGSVFHYILFVSAPLHFILIKEHGIPNLLILNIHFFLLVPLILLLIRAFDIYLTSNKAQKSFRTDWKYRVFRVVLWITALYSYLLYQLLVNGIDGLLPTSTNEYIIGVIWLLPFPFLFRLLIQIILNPKKA